ncbi:MAG: hypothetical protein M1828_007389 [Chrysothrix sp. TS-e1954]|nr:MAG: hypothetical protein M1828_007389 [Chrysothrix sp. TS-e1954]
MPPQAPKRRRVSGPADAKKKQPTLSFRPTKSGLLAPSSSQKPTEYEPDEKPAKASVDVSDEGDDVAEVDVEEEEEEDTSLDGSKREVATLPELATPEEEEEDEENEEDEEDDAFATAVAQAKSVSKKQVETYWRSKEKSRKAPRVHQQDLSVGEKILREWDLSSHYGPSIGISRRDRCERACNLGMDPPVEVLAVLVNGEKLNLSGGRRSSGGNKGQAQELYGQKSILDELIMSSKGNAASKDVSVEA